MEKVVFITGGAKNTGLAVAEKFASEGYSIALSTREYFTADAAVEYLSKKYGIFCKGYKLELTDMNDIRFVFSEIKKTFGGLDIFVANSANLGVEQQVLTITEEDFDAVIGANLKGNFFCAQEAAKIMVEKKKGSIVFIGSVHAHAAIRGRSIYAASKGGLRSLVNNMAYELGEYGIRVNSVSPGAVRTDRWNGLTPEEKAKKRENWPLGIESTGEDVANAVFYMGTDVSRTVTGTELCIDSGVSICLLKYEGKIRKSN